MPILDRLRVCKVRHKVPYFSEKYVKKIWRFSKDVAENDAPKE